MQRRTLVRTRDLASFREAVIDRALAGSPLDARQRAVVVPTHAAGELLRQSIEKRLAGSGSVAVVMPELLTRLGLADLLAAAVPEAPRALTAAERLVLMERSARHTAARRRMGGAPFPLRPGLVGAMLDFYDELQRRQRTVRRFASVLFEELGGERGMDRGSESLIHQTCFLGFTFLAYERALRAAGAQDEHGLRRLLLDSQPALPFEHLVVAVADHPTDPRGFWPADFDLIGRLRGIRKVDVVLTDALHDAGFRERLESELPGIEEDRHTANYPAPVLIRPPGATAAGAPCFVSRDREDELRDVVRAVRQRAAEAGGRLDQPTAVVFHRPLPYLFLAQRVFSEGGVPYQAFDSLPLAAQPYAAMLDVVLTAARTGASRDAAIELLRSGLLTPAGGGEALDRRDVSALGEILTTRRGVGEADTFVSHVEHEARTGNRPPRGGGNALRAARAAASIRDELMPFRTGGTAAAQVRAILEFIRRHERLPAPGDPWRERHLRARAGVQSILEELALAYELHDNAHRSHEEIASAIRFAVEARTFMPERSPEGISIVDAVAARFGTFHHVHVVGLVETDWPERPRRSIFYTSSLLRSLGWPQEPDQVRLQQAMFVDLLALPASTIALHAFRFEGDALLALSPLVELARDRRSAEEVPAPRRLIFDDEVLTAPGPRAAGSGVAPGLREAWLNLRIARPPLTEAAYGGFVGPQAPRRYRVSRVDHYVACPFKYFAENVLDLPEERDEMAGQTPLERGNLLHGLFEHFYRAWDQEGRGAITPANLPEAVSRFGDLVDAALERLPEADRALERTRLLGSLVAQGLAERVFELEADRGENVSRRLLECDLKGPFTFPLLGGLKTRTVEISGKADRIDVLANGSIRVIDYKLSRLPDLRSSIQIAVYAYAAKALLEARDGQQHPIASAAYLAFGDEDRLEGALGSRDEPAFIAVEARAAEFAGVIERIESGHFPPQPRQPSDCPWCRYAGVCRKEYREAGDETTESL